jgi:hypothetical protein
MAIFAGDCKHRGKGFLDLCRVVDNEDCTVFSNTSQNSKGSLTVSRTKTIEWLIKDQPPREDASALGHDLGQSQVYS